MVFLIGWRIMRLYNLWLIQMALVQWFGSNTQSKFHTTTKQSIDLTTPTISTMIPLHSLLFGGQSGGLQSIYISVGSGRSKYSKCKKTKSKTSVGFLMCFGWKNAVEQSWWWWEDSSVKWQPITWGLRIIGNSENGAYIREKARVYWSLGCKMMIGHLSEMITNISLHHSWMPKPIHDFLFFVHAIKNSPCVRGVTTSIMHLCVAQWQIHLN